ncbi:hypothetical protein Patl1_19339 [Pistacia atlantica]|uniref:Uncharacterized protein n=1 Tax=Pistacia atlantica TaxID=434234 RepID=A0ACC1C243_9ROSI|nr:hypothetical protein Patl1_19339 [Pistacia atlantica]
MNPRVFEISKTKYCSDSRDFKGSEVGEFTLAGLDSCEVRLVGCVNALFVNKLKGCNVYAGPVTGSILIEEVEGCVLVLASHQNRIHFAKSCDFYLRVRSRPIIEDCNGVRFGPYCSKYEGIEEYLEAAALSEETGSWGNVDDFVVGESFKVPIGVGFAGR